MKKGRISSYLQIGFFISLILNVVLLGFIISGPLVMGLLFDPLGRIYASANNLSPESRERVLAILKEKEPQLEDDFQNVIKTFQIAREQLTSKDLTDSDINQIQKSMIENHMKMSTNLGDMFKKIATSLKDEDERIKFFKDAMPENPPFPAPFKKNSTGLPNQDR